MMDDTRRVLRVAAIIVAMAALAACSTQPRPVRCDGRLVPINQPARVSVRPSANSPAVTEPTHPPKERR